jgi:hypothetical protein
MLVDRVSFPTEVPPPEPRLENATARHVISEGHAEEGGENKVYSTEACGPMLRRDGLPRFP